MEGRLKGLRRIKMNYQNIISNFFQNKHGNSNPFQRGDIKISNRYIRIKEFLMKDGFNGFCSDDLFIMQFIKKGWGQDIAALSNMAEAMVNLSIKNPTELEYKVLMKQIVYRALHPKVNPYKKNITKVNNLGKFGYYLEHLNIILGCYHQVVDSSYLELNERVTLHLLKSSMMHNDYHADLLPYSKMKWSADQAAIIYSIWLFDKNNSTNHANQLIEKWTAFMNKNQKHSGTELYKTEVVGIKKYSNQPRGCALAYLIHYMYRFSSKEAQYQWNQFKKHMMVDIIGIKGFREYLDSYEGSWTPDSGPIIKGLGIAATGLALNASTTVGDKSTYYSLEKGMRKVYKLLEKGDYIPGLNMVTRIGTDVLASSIWLNAETKV